MDITIYLYVVESTSCGRRSVLFHLTVKSSDMSFIPNLLPCIRRHMLCVLLTDYLTAKRSMFICSRERNKQFVVSRDITFE